MWLWQNGSKTANNWPFRPEYSIFTHNTVRKGVEMHFCSQNNISKDLLSQCLTCQSLKFIIHCTWSRNNLKCLSFGSLLRFLQKYALYLFEASQKAQSFSPALWDADPGLRVHSTACNSFLFVIYFVMHHTHHLARTSCYFKLPFCSFWILFVVFVFFQSCMLIQWLSFHFSVDVWSVGCIMAEMVRGSVLFPGTDRILKLNLHPNPPKMQSYLIICLMPCSYLCTQ